MIMTKLLAVTNVVLFGLVYFATADLMFQRVKKEGISIERYYVTTEDGYIIRLYRLMQPSNTSNDQPFTTPKSKTILLMHGLISSSQAFVAYRNSSAGYYFYDRGYDVWMGNARGNTFSRNHTTLDPNEAAFWDFTWHEIGYYDLPAMIDFILATTAQKQLICAGHSQGSTVIAVMLSDRPEYNEKVSSAHLMAGAIIMKHYNSLLQTPLDNLYGIKAYIERNKFFELFARKNSGKRTQLIAEICSIPSLLEICRFFYEQFLGPFERHSFYDDFFIDLASIEPNGASYLQALHFAQIMISGRFHKLDYGPSQNELMYGSQEPPDYNLTNIQTKVHILYGTSDYLVKPENFPIAINKLGKSVVAVNRLHGFNHMDFMYGQQVHTIPPIILQVIEQLT